MHIQVTIISRLKAATLEAKGAGKVAQREGGGKEGGAKRDGAFSLVFEPPL